MTTSQELNYQLDAQHAALIPLYFWQGPRPELFDLPPDYRGWLVCLSLQRNGDLCLLPLAWDQMQHTKDDERPQLTPLPSAALHTQAFHRHRIQYTVKQLQQDGWTINGRFTIHYTGRDAESTFHQQTDSYLWQTPGDEDGA